MMKIRNISIVGANLETYVSYGDISILNRAIPQINRLFKFNGNVLLNFIHSFNFNLIDLCSFPSVEAIAFEYSIYVFTDRICNNHIGMLIIHEYVHVCISSTFFKPCPIWLNEGLAILLSGQAKDIEPMPPDNITAFYKSDQRSASFYNMSLHIVNKLLDKMTTSELIEHARTCQLFDDDPLLGIDAVKELIHR